MKFINSGSSSKELFPLFLVIHGGAFKARASDIIYYYLQAPFQIGSIHAPRPTNHAQ